jgi:nicotinate dehydrogenase subunit B
MASVVQQLKALPDSDIRAMAIYLASLNAPIAQPELEARRQQVVASTAPARHPATSAAARLYQGACGVCHEPGGGLIVNAGPPLGLNTNLHADRPDNFLRVVIEGIKESTHGAMPGFRNTLDDRQIVDLARYARQRFAPSRPEWRNLEEAISTLRNTTSSARGPTM